MRSHVSQPVPRKCTRRTLLAAAAAATPLVAVGSAALRAAADDARPIPSADVPAAAVAEVRARYEALARDWVLNDRLARGDGYVYTVDWAQLFGYFARAGDRDVYLRMREHATRHLIVDDDGDATTRGFVRWRSKPNEPADASGTTEMLRVARALWDGAAAFGRAEDAELATVILRGYARHAAVDQGVWLIRNYYSFAERHFATNSFLVDYDPDFVAAVGAARRDAELAALADRCYGVYRQAVSPSGLIYDLVQPEIKTLVGRRDVLFYSPNDVMGLHNSVTCALGVARGLPQVAKGVLSFALARIEDLRAYYFGRTGEPVDGTPATLVEFNSLLRLAALAGGAVARQQLVRWTLPRWQEYAQRVKPADAYTVSEVLLTIQTLRPAAAKA